MSRMLFLSGVFLLGCGQSDTEAWTAFCDAPSACTRPSDLGDVSDRAREARQDYIQCVTGQARSVVDNGSVRRTYEGAMRDHDLDRIEEAFRAAGVSSCPMLDLIRENP